MNKKILFSAITIALLLCSSLGFSQTLELGTLSSFEAYTGAGAVTNSGTFTGDVGTNDGIISGFAPPSFNGTIHNNNALTVQARIDLLRVYIHLSDIFVTHPGTHAPAFGGGETITPGVYSIGEAGSIGGTLTLDGGGNPDAVFIIKFEGALTVGVGSTIVLSGGTRACNVFWIAEGAISVAAGSVIKGTLFSHPGAVTLGVNSTIEGRMLASEGAITIEAGGVAIAPAGPITIPIKCLGACTPAPAVDVLGSVANFGLFTSIGAVANTATSGIVGDIGTHAGAISGFGTSTHVGAFYNADAITAQAVLDLDNAYNQLMLLPNTVLSHAPAFGTGETLNAGVYYIAGAGSLAGTITLDGQNDPDAIFVFKFAGAFSVAAQSKVIFTNGTRRCNVFWISGAGVATGATDMGTFTFMKGTVIAHGGACTMGANGNLEGRMLSTAGAIGFSTGVVYNNTLCFVNDTPISALPIELLSFAAAAIDAHVQLNWATASETNNDYFNVERSADAINFTSISKINGAGNSTQILNYSAVDNAPLNGISYYRLKQNDYNGEFTYSQIEVVYFNNILQEVEIYPNPAKNSDVTLEFNGYQDSENIIIDIFNSQGKKIYQSELKGFEASQIKLPVEEIFKNSGLYLVYIKTESNIIIKKLVIY